MHESANLDKRYGGVTGTSLLAGAVVFLMGTTIYGFYRMNSLEAELNATQELLESQISVVYAQANEEETAPAAPEASATQVEDLRKELEATREEAERLAGQARKEAARHAEELTAQVEQLQKEQAQQMTGKVDQVSGEVNGLRESTDQRIGEVSSKLSDVRNLADSTQGDLTLTIAELQSTKGDLGVQSGRIATNARQLAALKALGEREYIEFQLVKSDETARVGDLYVRLKKTNVKHNQYTIEVIVDDKRVEKKDRTVNEPVQFIVPPAVQPYEFVVNDIEDDMIRGYLSEPKVKVVASR